MPEHFHWIETTGGPHILATAENVTRWRGIEGWHDNSPENRSDYARACRANGWLSTIPSGDGTVVVLGGDVGPIAWLPHADGRSGMDNETSH